MINDMSSDYHHLKISEQNGVLTVDLRRPPVNALNTELVSELQSVIRQIHNNEQLRVVILTGTGEQFCAGADLKERKTMSDAEVTEFIHSIRNCFYDWYNIPIPTICAMNGGAYGGGLELALMCDIRIIAEDALLGLRETRLGIIPGAGGTQRLSRVAGESVALRWIMTGEIFSARDALNDRVVDFLCPPGELEKFTFEIAEQILQSAPIAVKQAKKVIRQGLEMPFKAALEFETECYNVTIPTEDRTEALRAFTEKRPPKWQGK